MLSAGSCETCYLQVFFHPSKYLARQRRMVLTSLGATLLPFPALPGLLPSLFVVSGSLPQRVSPARQKKGFSSTLLPAWADRVGCTSPSLGFSKLFELHTKFLASSGRIQQQPSGFTSWQRSVHQPLAGQHLGLQYPFASTLLCIISALSANNYRSWIY